MALPPGILYFLQCIPKLCIPPVIVYAVITLTPLRLAAWQLAVVYALSFPLVFTVVVWYAIIRNYIHARALGARLVPTLHDPTPGGLIALYQMVSGFRQNAYPGEAVDRNLKPQSTVFNMRILWEDRIITTEPEHAKAILATQFDQFEKGTGVFASDGEMWKFHRGMTRPFFSRDRISHFDIFDQHFDSALQKIRQRSGEGFPIDFQDVAARFTLDSASMFLFGHDVHSLDGILPYPFYAPSAAASEEDSNIFVKSFNSAQLNTAFRFRLSRNWPLAEFWEDRNLKHMKIVAKTIDPILQRAIADKEKRGDAKLPSGSAETLLDHLVDYTQDETILKDEIMNIAIAGRDTTACTLTFAVYSLAQYPHVFYKIREEVLTKIGPTRRPTFDDFREMKYLRAVVNETLRLYPPVPFNFRAAKHATVLTSKPGEKPYFIPAGTRVTWSVFAMHRREDLWGPTALTFDPDRFLDSRVHKYLTPNPFIFLPFNGGPRICLGQQFAYHEASFFLVRLLQHFTKIELDLDAIPHHARAPQRWKEEGGLKEKENIQVGAHLTMYVKEGLWVRMEEVPAAGSDVV